MKTVTIKEYASAAQAYIDRGLLSENGINSEVKGEFASGIYPGLPAIAPVTLIVMDDDEKAAKELLGVE